MVCLLVLAQLPPWLGGQVGSASQPLFNLDLGLASVVICLRPCIGLTWLAFAWFVDGVSRLAWIYHFASVQELLDASRFAALAHLGPALPWAQILMVFTMSCSALLMLRLRRNEGARGHLAAACGLAVGLFVAADVLNGSAQVLDAKDSVRVPVNVAGSPVMNWLWSAWVQRQQGGAPLAARADARSYRAVKAWANSNPERGVLVVLVESLGLPRSKPLQIWLQSHLGTPRTLARWSLVAEQESFQGSTTYGELRVLCARQGHYSRLTPADEVDCLPRRYQTAGHQAVGLHGFDLAFFDRRDWWPRIGLAPWSFGGASAGARHRCNLSFPGVCDAEVLHEAVRLADERGGLVYALTLDTHLPLTGSLTPDPALAGLCRQSDATALACVELGRLGRVLASLEAQMAGMRNPPLVVVVGDHSPPFSDRASRAVFDSEQVPLYVLAPREVEAH